MLHSLFHVVLGAVKLLVTIAVLPAFLCRTLQFIAFGRYLLYVPLHNQIWDDRFSTYVSTIQNRFPFMTIAFHIITAAFPTNYKL